MINKICNDIANTKLLLYKAYKQSRKIIHNIHERDITKDIQMVIVDIIIFVTISTFCAFQIALFSLSHNIELWQIVVSSIIGIIFVGIMNLYACPFRNTKIIQKIWKIHQVINKKYQINKNEYLRSLNK